MLIDELEILDASQVPLQVEDIPEEELNLSRLNKIASKMKSLCVENNGIGLAAPQIGLPINLIVIGSQSFINLDYQICDDSVENLSIEGCLSILEDSGKSRLFRVKRYDRVLVSGFVLLEDDLFKFEQVIDDQFSVVFQHEIDHIRGIFISDIGEVHVA